MIHSLIVDPEDIASTIRLGSKDKQTKDEEKKKTDPLIVILKCEKVKLNSLSRAKRKGANY